MRDRRQVPEVHDHGVAILIACGCYWSIRGSKLLKPRRLSVTSLPSSSRAGTQARTHSRRRTAFAADLVWTGEEEQS